ncbi:MAG: 50S ribosomal protein L1 [uncultured bacterium]|uniref:Large ribosomal subunit protein uL1 n=2 Tax=Candidatus Daviesiibacteriota TaxID=1752718 RepID=A0A0G0EQ34_9BACT|nr:MAG: 50S ribosomal protein L1 [uncultured bacterium]KKQ09063.1 MAG: 50S ribosomal protein L1 [Candidatus Daviesbacteria bacterium GW2011_GWB1_36_5]KKQ16100.1 MAG: 50S ribosomal protein L1 [Candidatus Daviesbacteria bacterium GW2011_GWA1_36_8]
MGKKKLAVIDDSQVEPEVKNQKSKVKKESEKVNPNPELLEKERAQARAEAKKVNPNPEVLAKEKAEEKKVQKDSENSENQQVSKSEIQKSDSSDQSDISDTPSHSEFSENKSAQKKSQAQKHGEPKYRSSKYKEAAEKVEKAKKYAIDEAVNLVKETSYSKFDGSLEIHINTSVKNLRGLVSLPYASGKKLKIVAFGKGAEESGADIVGDDEKLNEIAKGKIDFDFIVTDPSWMPKLARAAKVLGPRGLMPNPKNGTISDNLKKAVEEIQSGKVEYKSEKIANVVHLSLGKISQPTEELSQNIKVLLGVVGKSKIKVATIAPSMGPGVKLDTSSI